MENNFDKYFKDHLYNRNFEMKDAYWEQAEAMLNKQEKKKKRGFFFWWTGAALVTVIAITSIFFFINKNDNNPITSTNEKSQHITGNELNEQPSNNANSDDLKSTTENALLPESNNTANNKPSIQNTEKAISKPITRNTVQSNKTNKTALFIFEKTKNINAELNIIENQKEKQEHKIPTIEIIKKEPENLRTTYSINNISTLDISILQNKKTNELPLNLDEEFLNNCYDPSPFHVAFSASQLFQAAPKTGENLITGFSAGIVFQYDLNKNFFLSSGISYMLRGGHFNASKITEKRNYRFGLELENKLLRPTSLHYISMPLMAGWQKRHHLVEGGFYLDYLMGVRGKSGNYERIPGEPPTKEFVPTESGWLVEDGFAKFNISPSVGYRYRVNKQLSFGLSAQYALKKVAEMPSPNDFILKENDRFNLRIQAVYILK